MLQFWDLSWTSTELAAQPVSNNPLSDSQEAQCLFLSVMYFHFCDVGQWLRRAHGHVARHRLKKKNRQIFSSTTVCVCVWGGAGAGGGEFQLCATNWAKTITPCEARANSTMAEVQTVTRSHLVQANLSWTCFFFFFLAVLNVTASSSVLIESCPTARSYSANKGLFFFF